MQILQIKTFRLVLFMIQCNLFCNFLTIKKMLIFSQYYSKLFDLSVQSHLLHHFSYHTSLPFHFCSILLSSLSLTPLWWGSHLFFLHFSCDVVLHRWQQPSHVMGFHTIMMSSGCQNWFVVLQSRMYDVSIVIGPFYSGYISLLLKEEDCNCFLSSIDGDEQAPLFEEQRSCVM